MPVPTLISLSNVPIPETNVPLKNVATPATCNVLAIDTLVGSKSPLTVSAVSYTHLTLPTKRIV